MAIHMFSTTYNPIHLSPPTDTWSTFEFRDPLHSLPPRVTGAILEVHNKTGAPVEIVSLVALSAMSTALHGYTIRPPNGRLMPMSLYCMGIGPPVCGKSAAMREFYRAIREFDANNGVFSHCLPLRRNVKATDGVMDSPQCIAIDEAENRLHVQKAVMSALVDRQAVNGER